MRTLTALVVALATTGCLADTARLGDGTEGIGDGDDDLTLGAGFDRHDVVSDPFFRDTDLVDAADVQALLERTPYGGRCFLADQSVAGVPFSRLLVDAARAESVNPLMLLARIQMESSLIARTSAPSRASIDFAFGCGCPDGRACNEAYRGLDRQVVCAAQTHARRYRDSQDATGTWRRGQTRTSLDGYRVTPANHATAALYAYTPHVGLSGGRATSGNALLHNVLQRFVRHLIAIGRITERDLPDARAPWVGTVCADDEGCDLARTGDRCELSGGFCTIACEGYCPDRAGHAPTFCVSLDGVVGSCVSRAGTLNDDCGAIPGTVAEDRARFVGDSGAPNATARVCVPAAAAPRPSDTGGGTRCDDTCALARDGVCEDGSAGAPYTDCAAGTDCTDCRAAPAATCTDTCEWANDGACDDGGPGSAYSVCALGTDCGDCGPR